MPGKILDCKGLPCPQPVLNCKSALESGDKGDVTVIVDNEAARENVSRFMERAGCAVSVAADGDSVWKVTGSRNGESPEAVEAPARPASEPAEEKVTVFITSAVMGRGDDVLGAGLMKNFLATLPELGDSLWRLVLVNGAVKLAVEGSPCLENLQALESSGVTILVCGTCLNHFDLLEQKQIGETTNMLDVVTSLQLASKVIRV